MTMCFILLLDLKKVSIGQWADLGGLAARAHATLAFWKSPEQCIIEYWKPLEQEMSHKREKTNYHLDKEDTMDANTSY